LPSTPARATQPHNEKIDSPPDTTSTSLSESENDDHPPSDVNTTPSSVYAADLRKICLPERKGDSESVDGDHSPVDVPTSPPSVYAPESREPFLAVEEDLYYRAIEEDLYYRTLSRLSRNLDLAMVQNVLIGHSKLREDLHEPRMHVGGWDLEPLSTQKETYIGSRTDPPSEEALLNVSKKLTDPVLHLPAPTLDKRGKLSLFPIPEEESHENLVETVADTRNNPDISGKEIKATTTKESSLPDMEIGHSLCEEFATDPTHQKAMDVSVESAKPDTATSPKISQKPSPPPAEIILIGGILDPDNPREMLVSCCKGICDRLPTVSTCVLYCAVAIYMIVMHLAELAKRKKPTLESAMAYLWSSPWPLVFALITGSGQLILAMMVVFSFMLMACETTVADEGSGKHKMEGHRR
jgi:hypothetical protein